jgi:hypothetical protein
MSKRRSGSGWYDLAGALLGIAGVFHAFSGLSALFKKEYFPPTSPIFGELQHWAWAWLILGVAQIVAAGMLLGGGGRVFGIVMTALSAVIVFMSHDIFPHDGTLVIILDVLIIYGLTVHKPEGEDVTVFGERPHESDRPTPPTIR